MAGATAERQDEAAAIAALLVKARQLERMARAELERCFGFKLRFASEFKKGMVKRG